MLVLPGSLTESHCPAKARHSATGRRQGGNSGFLEPSFLFQPDANNSLLTLSASFSCQFVLCTYGASRGIIKNEIEVEGECQFGMKEGPGNSTGNE